MNEAGPGSGGAHGNRSYDGFTQEQHDKDVTGNNALIEELQKHLDENSSDNDDDQGEDGDGNEETTE